MTQRTRHSLQTLVSSPVRSRETTTFTGTVREIDLDSRRFDLRGITEGQVTDLRCVYGREASERDAEKWLNRSIRVEGRIERDQNGKPRLLQVKTLDVQGAAGPEQRIFDFPETMEG